MVLFLPDPPIPPVGYFYISFTEKMPSRYTNNVSFRSGLSQGSILSVRIEDDLRMHEVEESLQQNSYFRVFSENPLQRGFYLDSITTGMLVGRLVVVLVY